MTTQLYESPCLYRGKPSRTQHTPPFADDLWCWPCRPSLEVGRRPLLLQTAPDGDNLVTKFLTVCEPPVLHVFQLVGQAGFEPAASASRTLRAKPSGATPRLPPL